MTDMESPEKFYTIKLSEAQLFNLRDILDDVFDQDMDMIDNPQTDIQKSLSRETRVEFVNETSELLDIVNIKINEIYAEESE